MKRLSMKWYSTYCMHCINNYHDRDNRIRFYYEDYHNALEKIYQGHEDDIDPRIAELFRNCVEITQKQVERFEIDHQMEIALLETLINVQVGYALSSHHAHEIFGNDKVE